MKLVYLITCHAHSEFLNFNLYHYLTNFNLTHDDIVISTANKSLDFIDKEKFKHLLLHDEDKGYGAGATYNIVKGLEYIRDNLEYDYIINIEPDNFFFDYQKMIAIINEMKKNDKHFIIDIHVLHDLKAKKIKFGTYNIFSKKFIENYFPFEFCQNITNDIYEKFADNVTNTSGQYDMQKKFLQFLENVLPPELLQELKSKQFNACEDFLGNAFIMKNKLDTIEKIVKFYIDIGYILNFKPGKRIYKNDIAEYHSDRFEKFGLINAFDNNFGNFLSFLERRNLIKLK